MLLIRLLQPFLRKAQQAFQSRSRGRIIRHSEADMWRREGPIRIGEWKFEQFSQPPATSGRPGISSSRQ